MEQQQRDRLAQLIMTVIAWLMVSGGLYLVFAQQDPWLGAPNVILGGSLLSAKGWRRER